MRSKLGPFVVAPLGILGALSAIWWFLGPVEPVVDTRAAAPSPEQPAAMNHEPTTQSLVARTPSSAGPSSRDAQRRRILDVKRQQIREALAARDADPAQPAKDPSAPSKANVGGPMSKEHIRTVVRELIPVIRDCYNTELEDDEEFSARVVTQFTILGDEDIGGVVDDASIDVENSEFSNEDPVAQARFSECIYESMYTMEFDPPEGGGRVQVTYPFSFAPA
jgi:hypothetical protein